MVQLYIILALLLLAFTNDSGVDASGTFTLVNNCPYTIWPGTFSDTGSISTTGFELQQGESKVIHAPSAWSGQFWARTHCSNNSTGQFTCLTGDCGSGKIECDGGKSSIGVTRAEFFLDGYSRSDFYDVNIAVGYNLPLLIEPQAGSRGNCSKIVCVVDLNSTCPAELKVTAEGGEDVACKSACAAFNQDKYCCRGAYFSPDTCANATSYSKAFKSACPLAYAYPNDDFRTTLTCAGADYFITFCPSHATSQNQLPDGKNNNKGNENDNNFMPPAQNGTLIYHGEPDFVNSRSISLYSTSSTCMHALRFAGAVAGAIAVNAVV